MYGFMVGEVITFGASIFRAITTFLRLRPDNRIKHLEEIQTTVLQHLRDTVLYHHLRVLEHQRGAIEVGNESIEVPSSSSSSHRTYFWRPILQIQRPFSFGGSVADSIAQVAHDSQFPLLYEDAKQRHFSSLLNRWEIFDTEMTRFNESVLVFCQQLVGELKDTIRLPESAEPSGDRSGANYPRFAVFTYERLWGVSNGALGIEPEQNRFVVRWWSDRCAQGSDSEMRNSISAVDRILVAKKDWAKSVSQVSGHLQTEARRLQRQFDEALLLKRLYGRCRFL